MEPSPSSRAPWYDLFKLIVALILLMLFLFLFIWMRPSPARQPQPVLATFTSQPSLSTIARPSSTPIRTPTGTPLSTATTPPTLTPTVVPSPTEPPVPEVSPTSTVEALEETNLCEAVSPSQLQVGRRATIVRYLHFRSSPGVMNNWISTNDPGTQVEIIGGPTCTRYQAGGSYLWWQIKLPNGMVGWSAEASASGTFYFMEPIQ